MIEHRVIKTPNGYQTIFDIESIHSILVENDLEEIWDILKEEREQYIIESEDCILFKDEELENYERQLELYHDIMLDTSDCLCDIISDIESRQRIKKDKLLERLTQIQNNLYNNL